MREGLLPNSATHTARLLTNQRAARAVADALTEFLDPEDVAAAAFEEPDGRTWMLQVFFASAPDEALVRTLVANAAGATAAKAIEFLEIAAKDWISASLAGLKPVTAGRFIVHGQHDRAAVKSNQIGLEIEAALAFGTGHHGTTRGCLLLFDAIAKRRKPRRILDVGTGTGILAIAAARLLRRSIAAGDIDPVSAAVARQNACLNGAGRFVRPVAASGLGHRALRSGAPYDLVFANILARPLRKLAPDIAKSAAPGASLILSGLLARDVPGVVSAYRAQGFALAQRIDLEGWAALHMQRRGTAGRALRSDRPVRRYHG